MIRAINHYTHISTALAACDSDVLGAMHLARDRILPPRVLFSFSFSSAMEVTGQDSTLYLRAAKLIISQTFHYMNQTTASNSLALSFPFCEKQRSKEEERRDRKRTGERDIRAAISDMWGPA